MEADHNAALLEQGRLRGLGDDGIPGALGVIDNALEIRTEVDAHGVAEDLGSALQARMLNRRVGAHVSTGLAGTARLAGELLDILADGGVPGVKIGLGGCRTRSLNLALLILRQRLRGWLRLRLLGHLRS